MPAPRGITVNDQRVQRMLRGIDLASSNPEPAWDEFAQYMRVRTNDTFQRLRNGGSYRGVTWRGWAPQYTRKDGTVVPAWGGIPKVRGTGLVQGRLRPSGRRVAAGDALMQDTGTMKSRAALVMRRTRERLELGPQGVRYAADQDRRRQFLYFEIEKDLPTLVKIMVRHLAEGARGRGSSMRPGMLI